VQVAAISSTSTSAGTQALTLDRPATAGNLICGGVGWGTATSAHLTSITDDAGTGNVYTIVRRVVDMPNTTCFASFYCENVQGAPSVLTANFSTPVPFRVVLAHEVLGCLTASALDVETGQLQAAPGTGRDAVTTGQVTPTVDGVYVFGAVLDSQALDGLIYSPGTGFTERSEVGSASTGSAESENFIQPAKAAIAATWTQSAARSALSVMLTFKPLGSPALVSGVLSAPGDATATFTGKALGNGVLSGVGDATASFVGKSAAASVLAAAADASATFTGRGLAAATWSAPGIASGAFVGRSTAASTLAAAGDASAAFAARSDARAVWTGSATGTGSFVGVGVTPGSVWISDAAAAGAFVGRSFSASVLAAAGIALGDFISFVNVPVSDGAALRFLRRRRGDIRREQRMIERYTVELERCRRVAAILQEESRSGPPHAEESVTFSLEVNGKRVALEVPWNEIDELDLDALAWRIYERLGVGA
jgi:hypothetical protein